MLAPLFPGFLCSFEKSRAQEQEELSRAEESVVSLLELCSRVRRGGAGAVGTSGNECGESVVCLEHDAAASHGHGDSQ